ncbi:MAG: ATP-binding cassette domain-containing protein [Candidatus Latescibacterota bacterium]|nr:ATP-binding cassette domain-containing protein [Candidatus Latescibacterota bacterium]
MIEVNDLAKHYGEIVAVEGVSFGVSKGSILGFLGPNGAGKTTTMRMLTCFLPPTSGTARVAGFDVVEESMEVRRRIGYLPEQPPLYLDMTVKSYLRFIARIKGIESASISHAIDETMEKTGIAHHQHTVISHLSKGYKQRVGLAQALVHNPDVLILDEPTVGLDPKQIIEIREVIKGLAGDHTVILSTHILSEVSMTCDKIVIINNGRIAGQGTPESLIDQLKDGDVLRAVITGPPEDVLAQVQSMEGVLDVVNESEEVYLITSAPGVDIRDILTRNVIDQGFSLRELRPLDMTLEDIFLRLTTEEVAV